MHYGCPRKNTNRSRGKVFDKFKNIFRWSVSLYIFTSSQEISGYYVMMKSVWALKILKIDYTKKNLSSLLSQDNNDPIELKNFK